jgi:hypothetical protein
MSTPTAEPAPTIKQQHVSDAFGPSELPIVICKRVLAYLAPTTVAVLFQSERSFLLSLACVCVCVCVGRAQNRTPTVVVKRTFRIEKALEDFKVKFYKKTMMEAEAKHLKLIAELTAGVTARIDRDRERIAELTARTDIDRELIAEMFAHFNAQDLKFAEQNAKIAELHAFFHEVKTNYAENFAKQEAKFAEQDAKMTKKKSQKALDKARRKLERAKAKLQTKQRAPTAAGKKRKNVDREIGELKADVKICELEADVKTKMATFKEKFKCDPEEPATMMRSRTLA